MIEYNYDVIKEELRKVITPDTVIACIGTNKVIFDIFGPLCGEMLRRKGVPYYGDYKNNINSVTMNTRLYEIYEKDNLDNMNIIAIDAAVTEDDEKLNTVVFKDRGVKPGAGLGKRFPTIGAHSILMFSITREKLNKSMVNYRKGLYYGRRKDVSDRSIIRQHAENITNIIAELYNDVCNQQKCLS